MSLILPDPRLEMPELMEGRKPVGPVKIDWDNSITQFLTHYYYPTDDGIIDLVTMDRPSDSGAGWQSEATEYGLLQRPGQNSKKYGHQNHGFSGATALTTLSFFRQDEALTGFNTHSILRHNGAFTPCSIGGPSSSAPGIRVAIWASGTLQLSSVIAPTIGKYHSFGVKWSSSANDALTYLDGAYVKNVLGGTNPIAASSSDMCLGGTETNTDELVGVIGPQIVWGAYIDTFVLYSMMSNPYQFLIPA